MKVKQKKETTKEVVEIKPLKIDLACGDRKQEGFIGVDSEKTPSVDIQANLLEFPWKFAKDNSVDELYVAHFVEHIPMIYWNKGNKLTVLPEEGSVEMFEKFFEECWRILKPGGKIVVISPYYTSMRCWQDPTHRRAINDASFLYLQREWRVLNKLEHCHGKSNFSVVYAYYMDPSIQSRTPEYQQMAFRNYNNVINDIQVTLTKIE